MSDLHRAEKFPALLTKLRNRGVTFPIIATRLGVSRAQVWRWSTGDTMPSFWHGVDLIELAERELGTVAQ